MDRKIINIPKWYFRFREKRKHIGSKTTCFFFYFQSVYFFYVSFVNCVCSRSFISRVFLVVSQSVITTNQISHRKVVIVTIVCLLFFRIVVF